MFFVPTFRLCSLWSGLLGGSAAALLSGCALVGTVTQLEDGPYRLVRRYSPDSLVAAVHAAPRFYVQQRVDTLLLTRADSTGGIHTYRYRLHPTQRVWLLRRRFDVDVFTIPFKVRPPQGPVPVQLNTNFNVALYLGRRLDFYSLRTQRTSPFGPTPHVRATGLGYGAFLGVGSTLVNLDVTNQRARVPEYEGFVVHGGLAVIYDARIFNIGLAGGVDQLLGADGSVWIYRRKPWVGVLFGLDLN